MDAHPTFVGFVEHKLQRVVARSMPMVLVSIHSRQIFDGQSAVPSGFTWKKTVLMPRLFSLSSLSVSAVD
jgi:hypothetical protein